MKCIMSEKIIDLRTRMNRLEKLIGLSNTDCTKKRYSRWVRENIKSVLFEILTTTKNDSEIDLKYLKEKKE